MIIACDIDGVLADWYGAHRKLLFDTVGVVLPEASASYPLTWDYTEGIPEEILAQAWAARAEGFWRTLEPFPECAEFLARLQHLTFRGHDVYFVTARTGAFAKVHTESWLAHQGFPYATVLLAGEKGPLCKALRITHAIDDRLANCWDIQDHCPTAKVWLVDKPYNQHRMWEDTRVRSILSPCVLSETINDDA